MKLTKKTLIETIKDMENGKGAYQARKHAKISVGRVYQIWNKYKKTEEIPELRKSIRRPQKRISKKEKVIIKQTYKKYYVCSSRLTKLIKKDYNIKIPTYIIHKIMLEFGFAKTNRRKDVRKKTWIRYERRHSLTAVHIDWRYDEKEERWFLLIIDDSSRKLLSLKEVESATTDALSML